MCSSTVADSNSHIALFWHGVMFFSTDLPSKWKDESTDAKVVSWVRQKWNTGAWVKVMYKSWFIVAQTSLLHFPFCITQSYSMYKDFYLFMTPTFISIIGTDGENGEAHVSILIYIDFIGWLWKHWLVIVDVTDEYTDICCVWRGRRERERRRRKAIINMKSFLFCQREHLPVSLCTATI